MSSAFYFNHVIGWYLTGLWRPYMSQLFERVVNIFGCGPCLTVFSCDDVRCHLESPSEGPASTPLMTAPAKCSMLLQTDHKGAKSSPDENFYRQPSWNTNIKAMRETSPFYQVQSCSRGATGVELTPLQTNLLLGHYHLNPQGIDVPPFPGTIVQRPVSPTGSSWNTFCSFCQQRNCVHQKLSQFWSYFNQPGYCRYF